jgi:hypothetical protein
MVPIASGQKFRFHFRLNDAGYLYILGPGEGNKPTAFLTSKPAAASGVTTNQISASQDFSFPSGEGNALELDKNPGAETYRVIFSRKPLDTVSFLNSEVTGTPLSESERQELDNFLAKNQSGEAATELNDSNASEPFVQLRIPQSVSTDNPVIFLIRIQHK